jgi:hypothetical protein
MGKDGFYNNVPSFVQKPEGILGINCYGVIPMFVLEYKKLELKDHFLCVKMIIKKNYDKLILNNLFVSTNQELINDSFKIVTSMVK